MNSGTSGELVRRRIVIRIVGLRGKLVARAGGVSGPRIQIPPRFWLVQVDGPRGPNGSCENSRLDDSGPKSGPPPDPNPSTSPNPLSLRLAYCPFLQRQVSNGTPQDSPSRPSHHPEFPESTCKQHTVLDPLLYRALIPPPRAIRLRRIAGFRPIHFSGRILLNSYKIYI
jgi:hypothetical protein